MREILLNNCLFGVLTVVPVCLFVNVNISFFDGDLDWVIPDMILIHMHILLQNGINMSGHGVMVYHMGFCISQ